MVLSPRPLVGIYRDAITSAAEVQVQAAFNVLVQSVIQRESDGLVKFVSFVALIDGVRLATLQALDQPLPSSSPKDYIHDQAPHAS